MTPLWYPLDIELALSERIRRAQEAREWERRGEKIGSELPCPLPAGWRGCLSRRGSKCLRWGCLGMVGLLQNQLRLTVHLSELCGFLLTLLLPLAGLESEQTFLFLHRHLRIGRTL